MARRNPALNAALQVDFRHLGDEAHGPLAAWRGDHSDLVHPLCAMLCRSSLHVVSPVRRFLPGPGGFPTSDGDIAVALLGGRDFLHGARVRAPARAGVDLRWLGNAAKRRVWYAPGCQHNGSCGVAMGRSISSFGSASLHRGWLRAVAGQRPPCLLCFCRRRVSRLSRTMEQSRQRSCAGATLRPRLLRGMPQLHELGGRLCALELPGVSCATASWNGLGTTGRLKLGERAVMFNARVNWHRLRAQASFQCPYTDAPSWRVSPASLRFIVAGFGRGMSCSSHSAHGCRFWLRFRFGFACTYA